MALDWYPGVFRSKGPGGGGGVFGVKRSGTASSVTAFSSRLSFQPPFSPFSQFGSTSGTVSYGPKSEICDQR